MNTRNIFLATLTALSVVATGPAMSYTQVQQQQQGEARDSSGRITVEAATIHAIQCNSAGENGRGFYIYQYQNRAGFRAISPPNWGQPIGGRDWGSFQEATSAACGGSTGPTQWTKCAGETDHCNFTGTRTVYYGANDKYISKVATNGIDCTNQVFGRDPIYSVRKACYLAP